MERGKRNILLVLLVIAFLVRLKMLPAVSRPFPDVDEQRYVEAAVRLVEQGYLAYNDSRPNAFVTPGYILFLAGLYLAKEVLALSWQQYLSLVFLAQAILSTATAFLIYLLGERVWDERKALVATAVFAFYPPAVAAAGRFMTEVLFSFFLLLTVSVFYQAFIRENSFLHGVAGALLALTTLIRPTPAPLLLLFYLKDGLTSIRCYFPYLLAAFLSFSLVMLPWWGRNYLLYHRFVPFSTEGGNPLLRGTDLYDPYDNIGPSVIANVPPDKWTETALRRIGEGLRKEPLRWLGWYTVGKFKILWGQAWGYVPAWLNYRQTVYLHLVLVALGWAGLVRNWERKEGRLLALVPLYFTFVQLLFVPLGRYMFPVIPLMLLFAADTLFTAIAVLEKKGNFSLFFSILRRRAG